MLHPCRPCWLPSNTMLTHWCKYRGSIDLRLRIHCTQNCCGDDRRSAIQAENDGFPSTGTNLHPMHHDQNQHCLRSTNPLCTTASAKHKPDKPYVWATSVVCTTMPILSPSALTESSCAFYKAQFLSSYPMTPKWIPTQEGSCPH
jgi:hypothetical protein